MKKTLADITVIKAGHPFRGKIPEDEDGNAFAIQIRDINEDGGINWDKLVRMSITGRKTPDWLAKGDILFAARGQRNVAACLDEVSLPTVCAPHYFIIQIKSEANVLPEFLAWQLNQQPAQRYFAQSAEGSLQLSIRRAVLEATPIVTLSLKDQHAIVALDNRVKQEKRVFNALIVNRAKQVQAIANNLLSSQ